jgi:hypothetical protein
MPRRGQIMGTVAGPFPGDPDDPRAFPALWARYETHMSLSSSLCKPGVVLLPVVVYCG